MPIFTFILLAVAFTVTNCIIFFIFERQFEEKAFVQINKRRIHHSLLGVALIIIDLIIIKSPYRFISALGLGFYIAHGIEELHIGRVKSLRAFFIFITELYPTK